MFLSKLQILGFKSFPQKTEFHFDREITAIVGPNGCGKTNILDALRWVLGEQRTTLLRSSRMEEVIFSGTKDLKPLGMAEVTLVIENTSGLLPIDYNQVTVTRRLFRSGESEYLLNKAPCRLKDITELFLDTGVGIHAYSVIQPEMVEAILSEKAEERRFMFEEAAGITKYKVRKKEAERKLEHTENDLLRLGDILAEVEKQANSLRRQKGKAERYRKLTEEVRELEIKLSQNEFQILKLQEKELEDKLRITADQARKTSSDLDKEEAELEELRLRLLEAEKQSGSAQRRITELSEKGFQLERDISVNRERRANLEKLIDKNSQELENLSIRLSCEIRQKEEKAEKLNQLIAEIDSKKKACETEEEVLLANDEKLQQVKGKLERLSEELQELNSNTSRLASEKENTNTQIEELKQRESILTEETRSVERRIRDISAKLTNLASEDKDRKQLLAGKMGQVRLLKERVESNQSDLAKLNSEAERIRSALDGEKARLEMLRKITEHYEGYGTGERSVLSGKQRLSGIVDTVANLITTPPEYLKAVESALGASLQFIVCQDVQSALNAIHHLKSQKAGRATFLPLDRINAVNIDSNGIPLNGFPEAIGWASDLVECGQDFKKLADLLLAKVIVVRTLDQALALSAKMRPGYHLVTLEGEMLKTEGAVSGGSPKELSLLGRELEIRKLEEQVTQLTQKLNQIEAHKKDKESESEELQKTLSQISAESEECTRETQQSEIEFKTLEFESTSLQKRREELEELGQSTKDKIAELNRKGKTLKQNIDELAGQTEKLSSQLEEEKQLLEETEAFHTETFRKVNQLKIEMVSMQGKEEQIRNEQDRVSELISEIKNAQAAKKKECEDSRAEIRKIDRTTIEAEKELKETFEIIQEHKANLNAIVENQTQWQESLKLKEKNLKASRDIKEKVRDQAHQLEMEMAELSSRAKSAKDRISEEYQLDLEKLQPSACLEIEETQNLKERVNVLKEKLKSVGPVNLLALEEYQSAKQRLDFLQSQVRDLTEAKETLTSTILKINNTARSLFSQTFDQIKHNFQKVFEELFDGGETDLSLSEAADPLESPVRISARPYGKRLLNISQLSGGEKALTAIALLFAIYLVKPSPFCILDEVDAPLDDANITRFLKLIKHFSANTQFILITHNKLTMEAADILYGVTMEQPGVSRIVSVKLEERELITK
ncbi:MAG: chromosome segregation protein SMC [candidate division Zixibacteria bacterium]|nr:chromosome segregation protein SMC [candidate division Zixibacteria bacterium]